MVSEVHEERTRPGQGEAFIELLRCALGRRTRRPTNRDASDGRTEPARDAKTISDGGRAPVSIDKRAERVEAVEVVVPDALPELTPGAVGVLMRIVREAADRLGGQEVKDSKEEGATAWRRGSRSTAGCRPRTSRTQKRHGTGSERGPDADRRAWRDRRRVLRRRAVTFDPVEATSRGCPPTRDGEGAG